LAEEENEKRTKNKIKKLLEVFYTFVLLVLHSKRPNFKTNIISGLHI